MSSIPVKPGKGSNVQAIATDEIDNVHHPLYKMEFGAAGAATQISESDPLPVALDSNQILRENLLKDSIDQMVIQLKIANMYQSMKFDVTLTERDL